MAQVTVYTADGRFSTTANDEAREGEERSELERLLAGDISGREGFEGGSVGSPPPGTQLDNDEDDFSAKLEAALGRFGQPNPVDIPEFVPTPNQIESLVPWLAGKGDLLQVYTDAYIETGSGDFAIAAVRQSESYSTFYPGITRDDGSLRMNETQYESTREGFFRILLENGLNPTIFDGLGKVASLIAGDVSVPEFKTRVEQARAAFVDNPLAEEIKSYYTANFDINLSDNAVFAAALDPDMSIAILSNQIDQAEIGAEAALRNLDLNTTQAQRLLQAGITQQGASRLFARGADTIGTLNRLSRIQNRDVSFNVEDVIQSQVFQDPESIRQQSLLIQQQQGESSPVLGARRTQAGAVAGLEEA